MTQTTLSFYKEYKTTRCAGPCATEIPLILAIIIYCCIQKRTEKKPKRSVTLPEIYCRTTL